VYAPTAALFFAAVTGLLLILDLKQPTRFHYIFTRPQWGSWLVKGSFILLAMGLVGSLWWLGGLFDMASLVRAMAIPGIIFGAGTAGYTAWLFAQCEGRDLWQTPLMLPVLLAQAVSAGAAALIIPIAAFDVDPAVENIVLWSLFGGLVAQAVLVAIEGNDARRVSRPLLVRCHGWHGGRGRARVDCRRARQRGARRSRRRARSCRARGL
jgi:formate-dependent nitrite reductase membrane component NrfD